MEINFSMSHLDYCFGPVKRLHSLLSSSHFLSPVSFLWLYWLFSFYIIYLSYLSSFFSSLLCSDSPVPVCLTIILVLPFPLHTKPVDLTCITRATSFTCDKEEERMQQTTGFDVSIGYTWVFCLLAADEQTVPSLQAASSLWCTHYHINAESVLLFWCSCLSFELLPDTTRMCENME